MGSGSSRSPLGMEPLPLIMDMGCHIDALHHCQGHYSSYFKKIDIKLITDGGSHGRHDGCHNMASGNVQTTHHDESARRLTTDCIHNAKCDDLKAESIRTT